MISVSLKMSAPMVALLMTLTGQSLASGRATDQDETNYARRDRMRKVFSQVKDSLTIVQCNDKSGSGFVAEMEDGKNYFITNRHVVEGQERVAAYLLNGKELQLGTFQVAKNRDLVRFELKKDIPAVKLADGTPNVADEIYVFGNSDGKGVATDLDGEIVGVGTKEIEVSARFVKGNSGGAVFDKDGKVVGVATYVLRDAHPEEWIKRDSRFEKIRRFALRLINIEWDTLQYKQFYKACIEEQNKRNKERGIFPQVFAKFSNPNMTSRRAGSNSFMIKSNITLSLLSPQHETIKNPVIRVCVLIKGRTGEYYVRDCILDKTGSLKYVRECPPVYANGDRAEGRAYPIGNDLVVYYLEGLSYYQRQFSEKKRKGICYFDRTQDVERGLFRVSESLCGGPPDIVCFRLECWQNGALAGFYSSKSPEQLNAKSLPVDWHCQGRYPMRFNYKGIGIY